VSLKTFIITGHPAPPTHGACHRFWLTIQREESIAKRRNFQPTSVDDNLDSDDDLEIGTSALNDNLNQMLQAVWTDNQESQLDATTKFRK